MSTIVTDRNIIHDVACHFDDGKFVLTDLPDPTPEVFTVRFTTPEVFTTGNVIQVGTRILPLRTPANINASSAMFRAGTVFHCDIDLGKGFAYAWSNQYSNPSITNLSYQEQFTGQYDENGDKIYTKTIDMGSLPNESSIEVPHNISNLKMGIDIRPVWYHETAFFFGNSYAFNNSDNFFCIRRDRGTIRFRTTYDQNNAKALVRIFYTCTDR